MDNNLRLLLAAANDDGLVAEATSLRRRFSVEFGRRGIFATIGSMDVYLCGETESAWSCVREPGGLDLQLWRLHLIVGRAPD